MKHKLIENWDVRSSDFCWACERCGRYWNFSKNIVDGDTHTKYTDVKGEVNGEEYVFFPYLWNISQDACVNAEYSLCKLLL